MTKLGTFEDWASRAQVLQTVAKVIEGYEFDEVKGIVTNPGKHESNPIQTLYYDYLSLEGNGETYGNEIYFLVSEHERQIFGIMPEHTHYKIIEDENGFVTGYAVPERFYNHAVENTELEENNE